MISLSLQPTSRPSPFQRTPVRPSTPRYGRFSLLMGSSPGLLVQPARLSRVSHSLSLRLGIALTSPRGLTRGLIMQKANGHVPKDAPIACGRTISGLFHSPPGVLFTFPSRYLFAIGHRGVLSLGGWSPRIRAGFRVSRPTWDAGGPDRGRGYGAVTLCRPAFQPVRSSAVSAVSRSRNPGGQVRRFGLRRFRSPLLAPSRFDFLSSGY